MHQLYMANKFLKSEIMRIKKNTHWNAHGENYEMIAKKIKSPLEKEFAKINKNNTQGLDHDQYKKQYTNYQKLMKELKRKNPSQYMDIYGSL